MFVTVTKINDEKTALVNPFICNKDGKLHVAIRSINYMVGYHNIQEKLRIIYDRTNIRMPEENTFIIFDIPPDFIPLKG